MNNMINKIKKKLWEQIAYSINKKKHLYGKERSYKGFSS